MRLSDWQLRFSEFAQARASVPFAWGSNDCCLFAADAVLAISGQDFAGDARGSYADAMTALRVMLERGGLRAIATAALGEPIAPVLATVGDVVLLENEGRELLAICNGTSALGPGEHGIAVLGMDAALAAWRV